MSSNIYKGIVNLCVSITQLHPFSTHSPYMLSPVLFNSKHLLLHRFCGSGIWTHLCWVSLAQHLSHTCSQSVSWSPGVIWRLGWVLWAAGFSGVARVCEGLSPAGSFLGASLGCTWASLVVPCALVPTSPPLLQKILFRISSVHILACTSKTRVLFLKKKYSYNTIIYQKSE